MVTTINLVMPWELSVCGVGTALKVVENVTETVRQPAVLLHTTGVENVAEKVRRPTILLRKTGVVQPTVLLRKTGVLATGGQKTMEMKMWTCVRPLGQQGQSGCHGYGDNNDNNGQGANYSSEAASKDSQRWQGQ